MNLNLSATATKEEKEEFDELDTNFERAYRKGRRVSSPRVADLDKAGFFDRISGRAYKDEKRRNTELCSRNASLEKEKQFHNEKRKRIDQQRNLHAILADCSNVQIGDSNTIKIVEYDPEKGDPIPMIKKVMEMMKTANNEIIQMLTVSENKLKRNNNYLQKIHSIVHQMQESRTPSGETHMMKELKEIVDIPTEKDDFVSIEEAFTGLKVDKNTEYDFVNLKPSAKRGIRLIVYKFGTITKQSFANVMGQRPDNQNVSSGGFLDENSCCSVILDWLRTNDNNVPKLIHILRGIDNQMIRSSMQDLAQETFAKFHDLPGKRVDIQPETSSPSLYLRTRQLGNSVLSLRSTRSDVSETFENIEKHVSETLQKSDDIPPDTNAILCALYSLVMDNTRTLQAVSEKVGASEVSIDNHITNTKPSVNDKEDKANNTIYSDEDNEMIVKYV